MPLVHRWPGFGCFRGTEISDPAGSASTGGRGARGSKVQRRLIWEGVAAQVDVELKAGRGALASPTLNPKRLRGAEEHQEAR